MRMIRPLIILAALAIGACDRSEPLAVAEPEFGAAAAKVGNGIPSHVEVQFGRDELGSPFPPPSGHDASGHARDKMFPRTVVLARGGSITFDMGTFHQVAIYDDGTQPDDVDLSTIVNLEAGGQVIVPNFLIDDSDAWLVAGPFSFGPMSWTSPPGTFDQPGRYLVICTVVPHFVEANMYAWVIVK